MILFLFKRSMCICIEKSGKISLHNHIRNKQKKGKPREMSEPSKYIIPQKNHKCRKANISNFICNHRKVI